MYVTAEERVCTSVHCAHYFYSKAQQKVNASAPREHITIWITNEFMQQLKFYYNATANVNKLIVLLPECAFKPYKSKVINHFSSTPSIWDNEWKCDVTIGRTVLFYIRTTFFQCLMKICRFAEEFSASVRWYLICNGFINTATSNA